MKHENLQKICREAIFASTFYAIHITKLEEIFILLGRISISSNFGDVDSVALDNGSSVI